MLDIFDCFFSFWKKGLWLGSEAFFLSLVFWVRRWRFWSLASVVVVLGFIAGCLFFVVEKVDSLR